MPSSSPGSNCSEYIKPGAALQRTEDEQELALAVARLSPEHREVLLLKDIDGLKYEDIAVLLGVPIGTIRSRLHRARLELRDLLVPPGEQTTGQGDQEGITEQSASLEELGESELPDGGGGFRKPRRLRRAD
jgi:RNA polymerase sigma-70 factor (ECF subfamily)